MQWSVYILLWWYRSAFAPLHHVILCPCAPLFLYIMCSSAPVLMCSFAIMSSLAPLIMWTFATFHHELVHSCGPLPAQGQDPISWLLKFPSNWPIADDLGQTGILMFTQHHRAKWWGEGNYLLLFTVLLFPAQWWSGLKCNIFVASKMRNVTKGEKKEEKSWRKIIVRVWCSKSLSLEAII